MLTDLLKTGAKQALKAAARTGLDVLENKKSLKEAVKTHALQAVRNTMNQKRPLLVHPPRKGKRRQRPLLARGGPQRKGKRRFVQRHPVKRSVKRSPPVQKRRVKKRSLDIFD